MIKKFFIPLFIFLFFLFISIRIADSVQAQETQTDSAQVWRCLAAHDPHGYRRPPDPVEIGLSGKGFPTYQDIHIVYCVPTTRSNKSNERPSSYNCSTGNPDTDRLIFGSDRTSTVGRMTIEVPSGTTPPQAVQSAGGVLSTSAKLHGASGHMYYAFFGVTVSPPRVIPGQGNTLQYGTFEFISDPKVAGCESIRWDPFGRVFDSQSLEPISNVNVTLLDKDHQFVDMPGLTNPEFTEVDGVFNFFVNVQGDPETFYLSPVKSTHTFTADPNLHPNYAKAYYDIYKPDDPIIEAPGSPEHRDIPLDPGTNSPFHSDPINITAAAVRLGRYIRYEGTVSHPLTIITLVGTDSGSEVARTEADREGFWSILVPHENIPQNESLRIERIKVDITTLSQSPRNKWLTGTVQKLFSEILQKLLSLTSKSVSAQPVSQEVEFKPILSYVEGFARDANGNLLPNATVKVKLEMSDGLYTQTTADENGFFSISPERLPIFDYYLEFVPSGSSTGVKVTTTEFVNDNQDYLTNENINLMAASKNGESLLPTSPPETTPDASSGGKKPSLFAGNSFNTLLTVVALIVLLGVAGGVLVYIRKKKSETTDLP